MKRLRMPSVWWTRPLGVTLFCCLKSGPAGFFHSTDTAVIAKALEGPTVTAFRQKARDHHAHILMGSLVEHEGQNFYNTTIFINPQGEIVACYRKIHLFGYQSDETQILTPGQEVVVTDTPWGICGFSTCYDLRFQSSFAVWWIKVPASS